MKKLKNFSVLKRALLPLLFLLVTVSTAFAQKKMTGTITDGGENNALQKLSN